MRRWTLHVPPATPASTLVAAPAPRTSVPVAGSVMPGRPVPKPAGGKLVGGKLAGRDLVGREPVLVPEGFSLLAALLPALWFLAQRMWLVLVLYLALVVLAGLLLPAVLLPWLMVATQVLIGLQAQDLRRWSLARQGLPVAAVVLGDNADAALLRALSARPDLTRGMPILGRPILGGPA